MEDIEDAAVKVFELPGHFMVTAPSKWVRNRDSNALLWLTCVDDPGSGILIDGREVDWNASEAEARLGLAAERFLNDDIAVACSCAILDAQSTFWVEEALAGVRTHVSLEDDRAWVFQFIFHFTRKVAYLLHWNGPSAFMSESVVPILSTFDTNCE